MPAPETERQRVLAGVDALRQEFLSRAEAPGGLAWLVAHARVEGFERAAKAVFAQPALLMTTVDALARELDAIRRDILG